MAIVQDDDCDDGNMGNPLETPVPHETRFPWATVGPVVPVGIIGSTYCGSKALGAQDLISLQFRGAMAVPATLGSKKTKSTLADDTVPGNPLGVAPPVPIERAYHF